MTKANKPLDPASGDKSVGYIGRPEELSWAVYAGVAFVDKPPTVAIESRR